MSGRGFVIASVIVGVLLIGLAGAAYFGGPGPSLWQPIRPGNGGSAQGVPASGVPIDEARGLVVLGKPQTSGLSDWPGAFDARPTAYDLDGDGADEIIAHSTDENVYVFHGETGRAVATLPTTYPPGWYIESILNGVAAGVLEPDQPASVVVTNHAAYVTAWRLAPEEGSQDDFVFERSWERRVNGCFENAAMDSAPVLADLDGDGSLEIVVQTEEVGIFALYANGTTLWRHCWGGGNADPVVDDLDGDGRPEVIFASDDGTVNVLDGATGTPLWSFDATAEGVRPGSIPVAPTVAELDGKAPREILFTARHAPAADPSRYRDFHMGIFAVHQDPQTGKGELLWMRQPDWAHPLSYTHLVVEDVDGDGSPDVFGMDWNTIGHKPGNWENFGKAHAFRLTAEGEEVWMRPIETWWSNKDVVLADVDRDGAMELLVNGVRSGQDGLWRLSADDGKPHAFLPAWPWKVMRGPVLLDAGDDAPARIALPVVPDESKPSYGAILLFEPRPSRS